MAYRQATEQLTPAKWLGILVITGVSMRLKISGGSKLVNSLALVPDEDVCIAILQDTDILAAEESD